MLMFYLLNCIAKVGPGEPLVEEKGIEVNGELLDFSIKNEQKVWSIIKSAPRSEQSKVIKELISTKEGADFFKNNSLFFLVVRNFGDDLELIKELVDKGKATIYFYFFENAEHLSAEVLNYLLDNIRKEEMAGHICYLIQNKKYRQKKSQSY